VAVGTPGTGGEAGTSVAVGPPGARVAASAPASGVMLP
ncbi:MAG: hypothetical protein HW378_3617, partial [Anaerolineales bacterium]|nr:hypothetical protein [Anaerolineales bacterium]